MRKIFEPGIARLSRTLIAGVVLIAASIYIKPILAQTAAGSIVGIVRDNSGNVIPGALVTALNKAVNQSVSATANASGYYSFPLLQPASYQITVHAAGFKEYVQDNVQLEVAQTLTVNATLQVGEVTQSVTVTSAPPLLDTQTSSLGGVIESKSIVDLPLNGRNSYGFANLVPGVVAPYGFTQTAFDEYNDQFISINGSRPNQNLFLLDGGTNSEPAFTGPGYFPIVDLVQEYKVQTNDLGAEYSNTGGGIINVITRSGSNKFHGSAWWFFRHTDLSANDFFSNHAGLPRAHYQFSQFGATLGGPIKRDKTFFFFAYEGLRWVQSGSAVGTLPTAAQRNGDFSSSYNSAGQVIPIYNPFSTTPDPANPGQFIRTQYPGNVIPPGDINPVAKALLSYLPLPNQAGTPGTGTNNYYTNYSSPIVENNFSIRLDHAITDKQKIFGRYSINDTTQTRPNLYGNSSPNFLISNPTAGNDFLRQQQATIEYTNPFRPNAILDLNSSYIRYYIGRRIPGLGFDPTGVGLPGYFSTLASLYTPCFPTVGVSGLGLTLSLGNIGGGLMGSGCYTLGDVYPDLHEYGSVTIVKGPHTFKTGGEFGIKWLSTPRYEPAGPGFNSGPNFTQGPNAVTSTNSGIGLASFLVGTGSGNTGSGGPNQYLSSKYWGVFFQDDWRITPKLTLNLGARYDYNAPWIERFNRFTDWTSTATSPLQVPGLSTLVGGLEFPGVGGVPRSEFNPFRKEFVPRLGFAYAPNSRTTVRGGYGIFFAPLGGAGFNGNSVPNTGYVATTNWIGTLDGVTPLNTLSNPFPQGFVFPTGSSQGLATQLGQSVVGILRNRPVSYSQQWNFDIQQELGAGLLFDIAYAGGHGVHLYGDYNPDQLPDQYLSIGGDLNTQVANPFAGQVSSGGLSNATVAKSQLLRPFPQFTGVTLGNSSFFGASLYDALQVKLVRRFQNGFSLQASYTWSKLMDNLPASETGFPGGSFGGTGIQDWDNLRAEWAVASFDTPQYFTLNAIYELPFGKGKQFLNQNKIANYFVGGWQLNGITSAISGTPQEVFTASNTLFNYGGSQRANWNGLNPSREGKIANRLNEYFTVSDFSQPPAFTYGNSPRMLSNLRSPGFISTDLSGIKNIPIHENISAQLRGEAFNLFNHPTFGPPDTTLGDGTTGIINSQVNLPRQIQVALKIIF
ncbi:MAG TPA: TonB-dependent receptor [Acidobacteriaceae bacterium]|nr:TonB-dependent receptor [Acidobacteriaceae bacterium]